MKCLRRGGDYDEFKVKWIKGRVDGIFVYDTNMYFFFLKTRVTHSQRTSLALE
jgi:hypothetical protein